MTAIKYYFSIGNIVTNKKKNEIVFKTSSYKD
jgi:hypothetical protein